MGTLLVAKRQFAEAINQQSNTLGRLYELHDILTRKEKDSCLTLVENSTPKGRVGF